MATPKEFKAFVVEQFCDIDGITCRPMMGGYLLYHNNLLFGGIYDTRVLVKITKTNEKFNMSQEIPYKGAKPMYMIEDLENHALLEDIVLCTCEGLKK